MPYDPSTYGDEIADRYDDLFGAFNPSATDTLTELAKGGSALELGIGTGRLALPLAARGVRVTGIDASPKMVEKLRAKAGGSEIPVTIGDFSKVKLEEKFNLIFIAFNTLFNLPTAEDQVRCFRSVASMLRDDGAFLIEAFVPDLARFDRGQRVGVARIEADEVWLEASIHNAARQTVDSRHVCLSNGGVRLIPIQIRYAWPSELDLMAQLAGMQLRHRWGGWTGQEYGSNSGMHVSVYERVMSLDV